MKALSRVGTLLVIPLLCLGVSVSLGYVPGEPPLPASGVQAGTARPSKAGHAFSLASAEHTNLSTDLLAQNHTATAAEFVSTTSGNWSTMVWSEPGVPGATDNVIIADGHAVTIDQNVSVASITVGQGTSGTLMFDGVAARAVAVTGNVTVAAGGTFITQSTGTQTHSLSLGGDLSNNGTFDMSRSGTTFLCTVIFIKVGDQSISGVGSLTRFRSITLDKGSPNNRVLCSINVSDAGAGPGAITFTNGTWEQTANVFTIGSGSQTIPSTGSIIVSGSGGLAIPSSSPTVSGNLTVNTSGTVTLGAGANSLTVTGGTATFASGTVTILGKLVMSGGTTTINGAGIRISPRGSTPSSDLAASGNTFDCTSGANLIFSSGSVTLVDPNAGDDSRSGRDLRINSTGTVSLAGSTFCLGDGISSKTAAGTGFLIALSGSIQLGNLTLHGGGMTGRNVLLKSDVNVGGTLTLTSGALTLGGYTLSYGAAGSLVYNGTSSQTTTDAEFPASNGPLNITINNGSGVQLHASRTINGMLTFTVGKIVTAENMLTLGTAASLEGAGNGKYVYGNLARAVPPSGSPTLLYDIGDLTNFTPVSVELDNLSAGGTLTARTTGSEHPSISGSGINAAKSVNRYWTLTNSGIGLDHYDATFNFVPGDVDAGANTSNFLVRKYDSGTWSSPTTVNPHAASIQATGMTTFSDFAVGEVTLFTISGMITDGTNPLADVSVAASGGFTGNATTDVTGAYTIGSIPSGATGIVLTPSLGGYSFSPTTRTVNNVSGPVTGQDFTGATGGYWITATAGPNGSISPSVAVPVGSDQTITMTPAVGYHIATLMVDGTQVEPVMSYTFTNVQAPHTIAVTFAQSDVPVTTPNTLYNLDNDGDGASDMKLTFSVLPGNGGTVDVLISPVTPTGSPAPLSGALPYYLRLSSSMTNFSFKATVKMDMNGVSGFGPTSYLMYYNVTSASWLMMKGTYAAGDAEFSGHSSFTFVTDHFTPYTFITSTTAPMDLFVSSSAMNTSANMVYPNNTWRPLGPTYHGTDDWSWPESQQVSVYIVPAAGTQFGACNVSLEWDANLLSYTGVDFGSAGSPNGLFGTGHSYPIMSPQVLQAGNHLTLSCSRLDNGSFVTSAGDYIAKVNLTIVKSGHSAINIISADFEQLSGVGAPVRTHVFPNQAEAKVYLGDFTSPGNTSTGDGKIDINDLSAWSLSYWSGTQTVPSLANYKVKYDIGPTANGYLFSLPVPDIKIDFEDLVIFSISFGLSSTSQLPKVVGTPTQPAEVSLGSPVELGTETRIPVVVGGEVSDIRAMKLVIEGSSGMFLGAEKGELLQSYSTPVAVMSKAEGGVICVDLAVMGLDAEGLSRAGEIVILRFGGKPRVHLLTGEARSSDNKALNVVKVRGAGDSEAPIFTLLQNYPNPFNPTTTIEYELPVTGQVELDIYNVLGEKVVTLVSERQKAGRYQVQWNGRDMRKRAVASGMYFYRVHAGGFTSVKKMVVLK
ncbi:MAG: T9SS type A sorting domain-containing protein [Bacteroidota bacterium]